MSVDIEHNEAKIQDFTVPLFELEQRVEQVESGLQQLKVEMIDQVADDVADIFNNEMADYLPDLHKHLQDFKQFRERYEMKEKMAEIDKMQKEREAHEKEEYGNKVLHSTLNMIKSDVDYQKNMWSTERLRQIDEHE